MTNKPEWRNKQHINNAVTILNMARIISPLVVFVFVYWVLGFVTEFGLMVKIALALFVASMDYLVLTLLVNILKDDDKTIG